MFNRFDVMDLPEPRVARQGVDLRIVIWIIAGLFLGAVVSIAVVYFGV